MPTVSIGDAELYYEDTGRGEPLLLVPGLSGRGSFWASQVPEFSRDFRVVVHDHRGTARSTHSRIRYSVEQMADDVLRLMDALDIEAALAAAPALAQTTTPTPGSPPSTLPSTVAPSPPLGSPPTSDPRTGRPNDPGSTLTTPIPPPIPQTGPPRSGPPPGEPIRPSTVDPRTGLPR
jgi:alpha/beta hydrolase fold